MLLVHLVFGALSPSALLSSPTTSPIVTARAIPRGESAAVRSGDVRDRGERFFGEVPTDLASPASTVPPLDFELNDSRGSCSSRRPPPPTPLTTPTAEADSRWRADSEPSNLKDLMTPGKRGGYMQQQLQTQDCASSSSRQPSGLDHERMASAPQYLSVSARPLGTLHTASPASEPEVVSRADQLKGLGTSGDTCHGLASDSLPDFATWCAEKRRLSR